MAMPHYKTLLTGFLKCICCVQEHRYLKLVYENSLIKTFEALFRLKLVCSSLSDWCMLHQVVGHEKTGIEHSPCTPPC